MSSEDSGGGVGETMAVTFLIGNTFNISPSLFASGVSITSALANEFAEAATPLHLSALLNLGLVLFLITFLVLACSRLLIGHLDNRAGN